MKKYIKRVLIILLALEFLAAGVMKLIGSSMLVTEFAGWGFPSWFMYVIGILEIAGAIGLFLRPLRFWALLGLAGLMIGALITLIYHASSFMGLLPVLITFVLLAAYFSLSHARSRTQGTVPVQPPLVS